MADDNHLVAVAYREFSHAQKVCIDQLSPARSRAMRT
jgi:hypothetical protein